MNINSDLIHDGKELAVKTDTYSVFDGENSMNIMLNDFNRALNDLQVISTKHYISYKHNLNILNLSEFNCDTLSINNINVYLNGVLLAKEKEYFFISKDYIMLNVENEINDIFTVELVSTIKDFKPKENGNVIEKTMINDIIVKLNNYIKTLGG